MEIENNLEIILEELAELEWELIGVREAIRAGDSLLNSLENTIRSLVESKSIDDNYWIGEKLANYKEQNINSTAFIIQKYKQDTKEIAAYKLSQGLRRFNKELFKMKKDINYDVGLLLSVEEHYLEELVEYKDESVLRDVNDVFIKVSEILKQLMNRIDNLKDEEIKIRLIYGINKIWIVNEEYIPI